MRQGTGGLSSHAAAECMVAFCRTLSWFCDAAVLSSSTSSLPSPPDPGCGRTDAVRYGPRATGGCGGQPPDGRAPLNRFQEPPFSSSPSGLAAPHAAHPCSGCGTRGQGTGARLPAESSASALAHKKCTAVYIFRCKRTRYSAESPLVSGAWYSTLCFPLLNSLCR